MLNKLFKFRVFKVLYRIVNVRFDRFPNQAEIKTPIVEKVPKDFWVYEYNDWTIVIYKESNSWKWRVEGGCIVLIENCAATKEEAIVSAEAWVDRYPEN